MPALATVFCLVAQADQRVTLAWDPTPDPGVAGYVLYYGTNTGTYHYRLDVGTNTATTVSCLTEGQTYFFMVTAYNAQKVESEPSNEVGYLTPSAIRLIAGASPDEPMYIRFSVAPGYRYEIQATEDFLSWVTIWESTANSNCWVEISDPEAASRPMRFYRSVYY